MKIIRATAENTESLFALRLRGLEDAPQSFLVTLHEESARGPSFLQQRLEENSDDNVIFAVFDGPIAVAMGGIVHGERFKTKHKAVIWGIYVDVAYRGRGLASAIIGALIEHARTKMSVSCIYLSVESTNDAARKIYEKFSFISWGREPKAMFDGVRYFDEDHMVLQL